MSNKYKFSCGCSWPILKDAESPNDLPVLDFDINKAPESCPAVWEMLGRGETKGIFQLESRLGKQYCKKLSPTSIEHLGALGAILRPGTLGNIDENGVSSTDHFCMKKNGEEPIGSVHPIVDRLLENTYGELVYQEQSLFLAQEIAGFDLKEADNLRKSLGKKLPELMAECKIKFLEGAEKTKAVPMKVAEDVFKLIESGQNYLFNKSHSISYGIVGFHTAYLKAHFPLQFFRSWLYYSKEKQDPLQEIYDLVNEAKLFNIEVQTPSLLSPQENFHIDGNSIRFGLSDIKGVGQAQIIKIKENLRLAEKICDKPIREFSFFDILTCFADYISSTAFNRLVMVGALSWLDMPRQKMIYEYEIWQTLTDKEKTWIQESKLTNLTEALDGLGHPKKEGGGCANKKRVSHVRGQLAFLLNPPTQLEDSPHQIAWAEKEYLGISVSCSKIDGCDIAKVNASCRDFINGQTGFLVIGVEINECTELTTKKGQNPGQKMGRMTVSDGTCSLDSVICFPKEWDELKHIFTEGNTVIIQGEREMKKGYENTFIVKKAWQATLQGT